MKIVQLITELYPAGAEKIVLNLSGELKRRGHDVSVISLQPLPIKQTYIVDELIKNDIEVRTLNVTKFTPWRISRLNKLLNQKSEIILHAHLIHANLVSRIANLLLSKKNIRIINTIHIAEKRKSKWWHFFLDKITFNLCDVQTAVSEAAQQYHAEKIGVSPEKISVIYNGIVPPKHFTEDEITSIMKDWNLEDCTKIIGSVGRLDWQKGYDIFLKLIPELSKKVPSGEKWGIVLLGEGPQRNILQKIIDENNFNNIKAILPGYRNDAADCMSAFDLFIMPSRYEGFGLTLIEAMAHGIPCICSKADSLPNLIKSYSLGKSSDFNSDNIIDSITDMIMCKKQKSYFLFTIKDMADSYLKVYSTVC